jgi:hypothetical protein
MEKFFYQPQPKRHTPIHEKTILETTESVESESATKPTPHAPDETNISNIQASNNPWISPNRYENYICDNTYKFSPSDIDR